MTKAGAIHPETLFLEFNVFAESFSSQLSYGETTKERKKACGSH
jgi:hypothetical protein